MRHADTYGLTAVEPEIDTARVFERIRSIQADIAATDDNADRFIDAGPDVHFGAARLTAHDTLEVDGVGTLRSRFFLLCTGSRPATPSVPGLQETGFLTSESVWQIERAPESLVVIGGGPISMELSQAFARLGVQTTLLERSPGVLSRDEPELAARLAAHLRGDGVELVTDVEIETVAVEDGAKVVRGTVAGAAREWRTAEIFVGAGRKPNVEGLGLEEVGVQTGPKGVVVDASLRSSVKSIYAAGDLAGRFLFTTRPATKQRPRCATCSSPAPATPPISCPGAPTPTPSLPTPG